MGEELYGEPTLVESKPAAPPAQAVEEELYGEPAFAERAAEEAEQPVYGNDAAEEEEAAANTNKSQAATQAGADAEPARLATTQNVHDNKKAARSTGIQGVDGTPSVFPASDPTAVMMSIYDNGDGYADDLATSAEYDDDFFVLKLEDSDDGLRGVELVGGPAGVYIAEVTPGGPAVGAFSALNLVADNGLRFVSVDDEYAGNKDQVAEAMRNAGAVCEITLMLDPKGYTNVTGIGAVPTPPAMSSPTSTAPAGAGSEPEPEPEPATAAATSTLDATPPTMSPTSTSPADIKSAPSNFIRPLSPSRPMAQAHVRIESAEGLYEKLPPASVDADGGVLVSIARAEGEGYGMTLMNGAKGVFVTSVKAGGPAEGALQRSGLSLSSGLRFQTINGTDVYNGTTSDARSAIKTTGNTLNVVFTNDPVGLDAIKTHDVSMKHPGVAIAPAIAAPLDAPIDNANQRGSGASSPIDGVVFASQAVTMTKKPDEKWGLKLKLDGEGPVLEAVVPGAAASRAPELQRGVRLLAVGDSTTAGLTKAEIGLLMRAAGDTMTLTVQETLTSDVGLTIVKSAGQGYGVTVASSDGNGVYITTVKAGGSADAALQRAGHEIVHGLRFASINGEDVFNSAKSDVTDAIKASDGVLALVFTKDRAGFDALRQKQAMLKNEIKVPAKLPANAVAVTIFRASHGMKLANGDEGVFLTQVKPGSVVAVAIEDAGEVIESGLRFAAVNGEDVWKVDKADIARAIKAADKTLEVVFVKDPTGFAALPTKKKRGSLRRRSNPPPSLLSLFPLSFSEPEPETPMSPPPIVRKGAPPPILGIEQERAEIANLTTELASIKKKKLAEAAMFDLLARFFQKFAPGTKTLEQLHSLSSKMAIAGIEKTSDAMKAKYGTSLTEFQEQAKCIPGAKLWSPSSPAQAGSTTTAVPRRRSFDMPSPESAGPSPAVAAPKRRLWDPDTASWTTVPPGSQDSNSADVTITKEPAEKWGMKIKMDSRGPKLVGVVPGAAASRFPILQPGVRLIAVNGRPTSGLTKPEVGGLLKEAGDKMVLVVQTVLSTTTPESPSPLERDPSWKGGKNDYDVSPGPAFSVTDVEITIIKGPTSGFGMTIAGKDHENGVFITGVETGGAAEQGLLEAGVSLDDGLRFKSVNGKDVYTETESALDSVIRRAGNNTLNLVLAKDSVGYDAIREHKKPTPRAVIVDKSTGSKPGSLGAKFNAVKGTGLVVLSMTEGGSADLSREIAVGNTIVSVNVTDVRNMELKDVVVLFQESNTVKLEIVGPAPVTAPVLPARAEEPPNLSTPSSTPTAAAVLPSAQISGNRVRLEIRKVGAGAGYGVAFVDAGNLEPGVFVAGCKPGGAADQAFKANGLNVSDGYRVIGVNGVDVKSSKQRQVMNALRMTQGRSVMLELLKDPAAYANLTGAPADDDNVNVHGGEILARGIRKRDSALAGSLRRAAEVALGTGMENEVHPTQILVDEGDESEIPAWRQEQLDQKAKEIEDSILELAGTRPESSFKRKKGRQQKQKSFAIDAISELEAAIDN